MRFISSPAPDLARQIELCWFTKGEKEAGKAFYEILPDSNVKLIFRFSPSGCRMVLLGPLTERACVEIDGESDYFGVHFRPGRAPRLADVHLSELINGHIDLSEIRGISADSLADRLLSLPDFASQQLIMEELLRGMLPLVHSARCLQATALLDAHGGQLRVGELASALGLNIRSLERLFLRNLGMTPKQFARLVRLRHLLSILYGGIPGSLADLASICGYADQSHMIKDFKELTGRLPGEPGSCDVRRLEGVPRTRVVHRYRP